MVTIVSKLGWFNMFLKGFSYQGTVLVNTVNTMHIHECIGIIMGSLILFIIFLTIANLQ